MILSKVANHPIADQVSALLAILAGFASVAWVVLDAYGQYRGHPHLSADPNLVILGSGVILHYFGRASKPSVLDKTYIAPTLEMPKSTPKVVKVPVVGESEPAVIPAEPTGVDHFAHS